MSTQHHASPKASWAPPAREEILEALRAADNPMTPAELAALLQVPEAGVEILGRRLAAMERDGQLMPNRKGVLLLASKLDFIAGRIVGHRDGFGFLIPDAGGPDLYLPAREMRKAMHGDRALVKQAGLDRRGKPEGRIVEITERANRRLVGRFLAERGVTIVVPEDQRIKHDVLIPPGDAMGAEPGQVVSVEIVEQPSGYSQPIGRVVEVLGGIDDPGMEIEIAVRKFDVPHQFPEAALAQAQALPDQARAADYKGRVDLRDVPLVTIDGEDARDFDDAVYCEPLPAARGRPARWRLIVAIADVSHYVQPADALDAEATQRSTSVYFPRRVIPMLPEKLSNGLCSLNPEVDRLVLVCDAVIDADGGIGAYQFYEAVMHSAARLTYDEVWGILSNRDVLAQRRREALVPQLQHLYELFRVLLKARQARGAIDFDTVETKIVCDAAGRIERIVPRTRNDAHRLIEECMLAANVCAADFMQRSKHPGLYRVHEGPTPEKLANLREFLRGLGLTLAGGDEPKPADYAALAHKIQGRPDHMLIQTMLLRSMQQAIYSPDNSGHFGLAYEAYTHFTSPIRRYPDLLTHRVIKALLKKSRYEPAPLPGEGDDDVPAGTDRRAAARENAAERRRAPRVSREKIEREAEHARWQRYGMLCSVNERRADDASRDVEAWLKCQYMRERVGEQYPGRVTGVAPFGIFVTLDELYVEGLVHVSELGSEYFQYNESAHELRGERTGMRFRLTDPVMVQVLRVDLEARRIEFRLVARDDRDTLLARAEPEAEAKAKPKRRAKPKKTPEVAKARAQRLTARQPDRATRRGRAKHGRR